MKDNPFTQYSEKVVDPRFFIGRKEELRRASAWLSSSHGCPSIAICGLPRIGKSSFAEILKANLSSTISDPLVFEFDVSNYADDPSCNFWNKFAEKLHIQVNGECKEFVPALNATDALYYVRQLLCILADRRKGQKTFIFLDEFDTCLQMPDAPSFVRRIRSIINDWGKLRASLVLVSRRSPDMIQDKTDGSTLSGVVRSICLRPFSLEEFRELLNRYNEAGGMLSARQSEELWGLVAGHPYLTKAALDFHLFSGEQPIPSNELSFSSVKRDVFDPYFRNVLEFFNDFSIDDAEKTDEVQTWRDCLFWNRLYSHPIPKMVEDEFRRYGLAVFGSNPLSRAEAFDEYLKNALPRTSRWAQIRRIELLIRDYIERELSKFYQTPRWFEDCLEIPEAERWDHRNDVKKALLKMRDRDLRLDATIRNRPIDYAYFDDLAGIIQMTVHWRPNPSKHWRGFCSLFPEGKDQCRRWITAIGNVRNPTAHARGCPKDFEAPFHEARSILQQRFHETLFD